MLLFYDILILNGPCLITGEEAPYIKTLLNKCLLY